jgi:hypothetical protein
MTIMNVFSKLLNSSRLPVFTTTGLLLAGMIGFGAFDAHALSTIKSISPVATPNTQSMDDSNCTSEDCLGIPDSADTTGSLPPEDPLVPKGPQPVDEIYDEGAQAAPAQEVVKPPVDVLYDISKAPPAVAKTRQMIIDAATTGDVERLRPLLNPGPNQTDVNSAEADTDPVSSLKDISGDGEGLETMSILLDILSTGFVHLGAGTPDEIYVWPYFSEKTLSTLTAPEKVELMRLVTAGDYADMVEFGSYNFYKVGIKPDGTWKYFTAGE